MNPANPKRRKLECPICFIIPREKVFQCRNGHLVCETCVDKFENCPQCQVSMVGEARGRNLFMEETLDELQFKCKFSGVGCKVKMKRGRLTDHEANCIYGQTLQLCKQLLGRSRCGFTLRLGNIDEWIPHMKTDHKLEFHEMELGKSRRYRHNLGVDKLTTVNIPLVHSFKLKKPAAYLLLLSHFKDNTVSWLAMDLTSTGTSSKFKLEISTTVAPVIKWQTPAFPFLTAKEPLAKNLFNLTVSRPFLVNHYRNDKEALEKFFIDVNILKM